MPNITLTLTDQQADTLAEHARLMCLRYIDRPSSDPDRRLWKQTRSALITAGAVRPTSRLRIAYDPNTGRRNVTTRTWDDD